MYNFYDKLIVFENDYCAIKSYLRTNGLYFIWKGPNPEDEYLESVKKLTHFLEIFSSRYLVLDMSNRPNINFTQICQTAAYLPSFMKGHELEKLYIIPPQNEDSKKSLMGLIDWVLRTVQSTTKQSLNTLIVASPLEAEEIVKNEKLNPILVDKDLEQQEMDGFEQSA